MTWIYNDGGRSACGFVGHTGDCFTRALAIVSGSNYKDIYEEVFAAKGSSPRQGMPSWAGDNVLSERGWKKVQANNKPIELFKWPKGAVIASVKHPRRRVGHAFAVVDGTIYDTWNPADEDEHLVRHYWTPPEGTDVSALKLDGRSMSAEQKLSQDEFDKVLGRIKRIHATATNSGSTDGERDNAIRMMQSLLLKHNLTEADLKKEENTIHNFTQVACPLNGKVCCGWEAMLGHYVCSEVFTDVQHYQVTGGKRKLFWFYGPLDDTQNCVSLFRELLLTITASARLQYGGYSRGSGASYCEGFVRGLPRAATIKDQSSTALSCVHERRIIIHNGATQFLASDCGVRLRTKSRSSRRQRDPMAESAGRKDGAKQHVAAPKKTLKITSR